MLWRDEPSTPQPLNLSTPQPVISITHATEKDYRPIVDIGFISVGDAHREAASPKDLNAYLERNYNDDAIKVELSDPTNIYYIIHYKNEPVGFSKINLNAAHPNIESKNVTKLDRIYLLKEFQGLKLGVELLNYNIVIARNNNQAGIWLYTWMGNKKAIDFYQKAGFRIIGSHNFYVTETHYNLNHHMFLELNSQH